MNLMIQEEVEMEIKDHNPILNISIPVPTNNKNRLLTMEKDISKAIETATPTKNEGNEDDIIPLLKLLMRIKDSKMDTETENQ